MQLQKILLLWIIGLSICTGINAQHNELYKLDFDLTQQFDTMINADYQVRYDSLAPSFKAGLKRALSKFQNLNFDSLSTRIAITKSADENLRIYSWDEKSGGSWHTITVIAQFVTDNKQVKVKEISGREGETGAFTDAIIYEIHELEIDDKTHYLTIGWGTHGGGHHHTIVQIFKIEDGNLINCKSCFESKDNLVVQAPRSNKINLSFNPLNRQITHNEFLLNEDVGFYKATGNKLTWKLKEGKFEKE